MEAAVDGCPRTCVSSMLDRYRQRLLETCSLLHVFAESTGIIIILLKPLALILRLVEDSVQTVTCAVKSGGITQSSNQLGPFVRDNRCGNADQAVVLHNAAVVFQDVVTGVGVRLEVVNRQQTVLQFELIGDPRCNYKVEVLDYVSGFADQSIEEVIKMLQSCRQSRHAEKKIWIR